MDTLLHEGVPVLRVVPGSPAAQAGLQPGEVLAAVDGKPVKQTADLLAAVDAKKAEGQAGAARCKGAAGAARAWTSRSAETPQEIPLNDPSLLYNKVMMDLRQQVEGYPGTEAAAFARLNLAICAMHFGDFAAAHEHLLKARAELPPRPGPLAGHGALLPRAWPSSGSATRRRRWTPTAPPPASRTRRSSTTTARRWRRWPRGGAGPERAPPAAAPRLGAAPTAREVEFPLDGERACSWAATRTRDIRVDEPLVSRAHARIERRGDALRRARPRLDEPHPRQRRARARARAARTATSSGSAARAAASCRRPRTPSPPASRLGARPLQRAPIPLPEVGRRLVRRPREREERVVGDAALRTTS